MSKSNIWQWDETAANNSDIAGIDVSGATGKVKDGDNVMRTIMSQIITMEGKGSDIASAGTLTLGTERYYHVTGTTTITDIDFTDAVNGRWAWLIFDGALTLTHNSTTLKLPGNANITTEAGDRALIVQDSSDNIICLSYVRASTAPPIVSSTAPTVTSGSGTITTVSATIRYFKWHRFVHCDFEIVVTTNGTGATRLLLPLPFTAGLGGWLGGGGTNTTTGLPIAVGTFDTSTASIVRYDGTYPIAAGSGTILGGFSYVAASV